MDNELVKRLVWSGLLAGLGALASIATQRAATLIWHRVYGEDPPGMRPPAQARAAGPGEEASEPQDAGEAPRLQATVN